MFPLFITLFLPLAGSLFLLLLNKDKPKLIKYTALGFSFVTFVVSLFLLFFFNQNNPNFQLVFEAVWIPSIDAGFRLGIDGMSMLLLLLTTFISTITILSSFGAIEKREKEYYVMILLLQFAMTGVFLALDLLLFFVFWELILIPMYFIIGIWGGKERIYASVKFFIFTAVGSLFMLVAIVWLCKIYVPDILHNSAGFTTNFFVLKTALLNHPIPIEVQRWLFLAFALSFCIKVPLFPFHTWLPDAHTEAPTPGSVVLAGVLLKMGTYGLVRFNLELFPQASIEFAPYIAVLAVIGIIYGALVSMVQTDVKRLVAFSSVSHLGFVVLGIFSMTIEGLQGAIIQMVNHGLTTGMLFLCVGMIYERRHTRDIAEFGGLARVLPVFTVFFGIAMLGSVGLPGLNGFIGEYLTLFGAFRSQVLGSQWYTIVSATGVIFAAVYLLWMFQRVMFGTITNPKNENLEDLNKREWLTLIPIVVFIVWIGVYPNSFLKISENSTRALVKKLELVRTSNNKRIEMKDVKTEQRSVYKDK
ncbi:MAG: NADH-quinone oxidoreductase subunit M [Bacteroidetes bacterium]|nr:NADH-quinone oxidoreductase subunit M [Bacteroidota bacterium]